MKNLIGVTVFMAALALAQPLLAAGSWQEFSCGPSCLGLEWTADASDGSVPVLTTRHLGGTVWTVETVPGDAIAPTAGYGVTIANQYNRDLMGGALASRSSIQAQAASPLLNGVEWPARFYGTLNVSVTGNDAPSARGRIIIWLVPGK
jgi:hypothetical protein